MDSSDVGALLCIRVPLPVDDVTDVVPDVADVETLNSRDTYNLS
jgi:hypothetical protein